jgi:hypothetical protein
VVGQTRCSTCDPTEHHAYDRANGGKFDDATVPSTSKSTAEADEVSVDDVLRLSPLSSNFLYLCKQQEK